MTQLRIIREHSYFDWVPKEILNYITDFLDDFNVMIFTSVCKRFHIKEKREKSKNHLWEERKTIVWNVPEDVVGIEDFIPTEIELKLALDYLRSVKCDLKRGDLIHLDSVGNYLNNGICIFDGDRIVDLASEIDDYGHIPANFPVITEFPLHYWNKDIQHNFLVGISEELNEGLIKNLSLIEITIQISKDLKLSGKTPYSFVKMHDKLFHFLFVCPKDISSVEIFLAPTLEEVIKQINDRQYYNLYDEILSEYDHITTHDYIFDSTNTLVVKMDQYIEMFERRERKYTVMRDLIYLKIKSQPIMILPRTKSNEDLAYSIITN